MRPRFLSSDRPHVLMYAILCLALLVSACSAGEIPGHLDTEDLPAYLHDRGTGVPTSMFGTYATSGELLFYPFFEYYLDDNAEYAPNEFGLALDEDFRGKYGASEGLIFLAYGISKGLVVEFEAAVIDASLDKSPEDTTSLPDRITESGIGDVQTQVDWLWSEETLSRPGFFSYLEVVYPLSKGKQLIGTQDWEIKSGMGIVRGFRWGTLTFRAAAEYSRADGAFELGEIALEYLKRVSSSLRLYLGIEGTQDEVELITEAQWHISRHVFFKFNNAFGVTSKATDWAPEVGVMFSIPTR